MSADRFRLLIVQCAVAYMLAALFLALEVPQRVARWWRGPFDFEAAPKVFYGPETQGLVGPWTVGADGRVPIDTKHPPRAGCEPGSRGDWWCNLTPDERCAIDWECPNAPELYRKLIQPRMPRAAPLKPADREPFVWPEPNHSADGSCSGPLHGQTVPCPQHPDWVQLPPPPVRVR